MCLGNPQEYYGTGATARTCVPDAGARQGGTRSGREFSRSF